MLYNRTDGEAALTLPNPATRKQLSISEGIQLI